MAQEVHHIKIFPEEQIQVLPKTTNGGKDFYLTEEGLKKIDDNTVPMWGVARIGDREPTGYRPDITPANKIPNRAPRIPCQFVVIAFDSAGNKINGGDVKDGLLYNGAKLPNGNTVELKWSATMKNGKWQGSGKPSTQYGDNRDPKQFIEETANADDPPTKWPKWLGFIIDDTGLLIPGNDGYLVIPAATKIGDKEVKFNKKYDKGAKVKVWETEMELKCNFATGCAFVTDRTCDGFVKVDYAEKGTTKKLQAQLKAVIAQPDWAVETDDLCSKGWNLL